WRYAPKFVTVTGPWMQPTGGIFKILASGGNTSFGKAELGNKIAVAQAAQHRLKLCHLASIDPGALTIQCLVGALLFLKGLPGRLMLLFGRLSCDIDAGLFADQITQRPNRGSRNEQ